MEMSEAKVLLEGQQQGESAVEAESSNVVPLRGLTREKPPPLSDEEVVALREMIRAFQVIASTCPIAMKALGDK
jgi:hypothetical protein